MANSKRRIDPRVKRAKAELDRAQINSKTSDLGGRVNKAVLELMATFVKQDHTRQSAEITAAAVTRLMIGDVLAPITDDPEEWMGVTEEFDGTPMWQNKRSPAYFSKDGGKYWYHAASGDEGKSEPHTPEVEKKVDEKKQTDK